MTSVSPQVAIQWGTSTNHCLVESKHYPLVPMLTMAVQCNHGTVSVLLVLVSILHSPVFDPRPEAVAVLLPWAEWSEDVYSSATMRET